MNKDAGRFEVRVLKLVYMNTREILKEALDKAFYNGSGTASGYISALCGMRSRYNLGEGDKEASRVKSNWPVIRDQMITDLLGKILSPCPVCLVPGFAECNMSLHGVENE